MSQWMIAAQQYTKRRSEYALRGGVPSSEIANIFAKRRSGNVRDIVKPAMQKPRAIAAYVNRAVIKSVIFGPTANSASPRIPVASAITRANQNCKPHSMLRHLGFISSAQKSAAALSISVSVFGDC